MFKFLKRNKAKGESSQQQDQVKQEQQLDTPESALNKIPPETEGHPQKQPPVSDKRGLFSRLKKGLTKTRSNLARGIGHVILGKKVIDADILTDIEDQLLMADIGVEATQDIIKDLTQRLARKQLNDGAALFAALKEDLQRLLLPSQQILTIDENKRPFVILMVGVNGAGKTTTIGKLAKRLQSEGKKVMLAAGDTFRAAAIEQLQVWGERNNIPVIAQSQGADSASVAYDALQAAKARQYDILIVDTAGRLHTQSNLMQELQKVKRVIAKLDETAPHEILLVLDAGNGQNALNQAKQFHEAMDVSGITLTKLDGTAKGGIIFAIAKQLNIPIRFIGVGESIEDLRAFNAEDFVSALFAEE